MGRHRHGEQGRDRVATSATSSAPHPFGPELAASETLGRRLEKAQARVDIFQTLGHIGKLFQDYAYPFEDGCAKNIVYESHKRGKNWVATVQPNRAAPGGLDRLFWAHGSGAWYKAPATFYRGDVVEMGGDYYSARGNVSRDRRYVLVVRVDSRFFVGVNIGETAPSKSSVEHERARHVPPVNFYSVNVKVGRGKTEYNAIVRSHGTMADIRAAAVASGRRPQGMEYLGSDIGPDAKASVRGLSVSAEVRDGKWHATGEDSSR